MKRIFKFYREVDDFDVWRWYVDLPEWEGCKADLEMVAGADVMLEYLKDDIDSVEIITSEEEMRHTEILLIREDDLGNYTAYDLFKRDFEILKVWLCEVTKFIYGYYPSQLYIKVL